MEFYKPKGRNRKRNFRNSVLEKERDRGRPVQTHMFMIFVHLPFYHFRPSDPLLLLIYLFGYVLYGDLII